MFQFPKFETSAQVLLKIFETCSNFYSHSSFFIVSMVLLTFSMICAGESEQLWMWIRVFSVIRSIKILKAKILSNVASFFVWKNWIFRALLWPYFCLTKWSFKLKVIIFTCYWISISFWPWCCTKWWLSLGLKNSYERHWFVV